MPHRNDRNYSSITLKKMNVTAKRITVIFIRRKRYKTQNKRGTYQVKTNPFVQTMETLIGTT
jgi:hypothetical protein